MHGFECKSCSTLVFISSKEIKEPSFCPICRGKMLPIKGQEENLKKFECPECHSKFYMMENVSPYKCINCNYSFFTTPEKRTEERF